MAFPKKVKSDIPISNPPANPAQGAPQPDADTSPKRQYNTSSGIKWVPVGRLWLDNGVAPPFGLKLSGTISLGILGEIRVKVQYKSHGPKGDPDDSMDIFTNADELPTNILRTLIRKG